MLWWPPGRDLFIMFQFFERESSFANQYFSIQNSQHDIHGNTSIISFNELEKITYNTVVQKLILTLVRARISVPFAFVLFHFNNVQGS